MKKMKHSLVAVQLWHMVAGTAIFAVLAAFAVLLDLASIWISTIGVSHFTVKLLSFAAHSLMVVDLILFAIYVAVSSYHLVKEIIGDDAQS